MINNEPLFIEAWCSHSLLTDDDKKFNRTTADLIAFYQFAGWHNLTTSQKLINKITWGIFAVAPYVIFILILINSLKITSVTGVILFGLGFFFIGYQMTEFSLLKRYEKAAKALTKDQDANDMIGPVTFIFTEEKIQWKSDYSEGYSQLVTIKKILEDNAYYYLIIASGNAWIIPKTALKTEEEISAFKKIFKLSSIATINS